MLEHQREAQEETAPALLASTSSVSGALPPQSHDVLVGYLAQTQSENADVDAVRARLEELTLAYLELDALPQDAAHSAIRQWETERQAIENRQAHPQELNTRPSSRSARQATLTALKVFGAGGLAATAITPFLVGTSTQSVWSPLVFCLLLFLIFGLPAVLGATVGMRVRNRPVLGTLYALVLLIPLVTLVAELTMKVFTRFPGEGLMLGIDLVLFWLPIGCLAAGVTGWAQSQRRKRRLDAAKRSLSSPEAQPAL